MFNQLRLWARRLKKHLFILYLAYKDERVSWYTKLFTACVVAYAFSPIDLIPDFIPILGYIDDIIIVPLGIMLALKLLPKSVIDECAIKAEEIIQNEKPKNWVVGSIIIIVWLFIFMWSCLAIFKLLT
ncbi:MULTISPECIES: YkvA family protein [Priestia]|uniref:YkvA family protein n=1 Tax=Priestia TaxID=2800373 RepID=UPI00203CFF58|nr:MULTISPECIES: YkvA family protein [Priestia]MCM3772276.1 YkvA family protein [Priestia aryabhattai]MDY0940559.1 YkvA family protein [Priestia megaterium]